MRLGLLGGTFDPIHRGHLEMAETAIRVARLNAVYFVTSVNPPHKGDRTHANFLDRHAMVALALSGRPKLIPSSVEYDRSGKSYSIDTLLQFREMAGSAGEIFFLIGMDAFLDIPTWKDFRRFPELCSFLVFGRPGYKENQRNERLPDTFRLEKVRLNTAGEATDLAKRGLFLLQDFSSAVSSTKIRELIRKQLPAEQWLPAGVQEYISKTKLYSS